MPARPAAGLGDVVARPEHELHQQLLALDDRRPQRRAVVGPVVGGELRGARPPDRAEDPERHPVRVEARVGPSPSALVVEVDDVALGDAQVLRDELGDLVGIAGVGDVERRRALRDVHGAAGARLEVLEVDLVERGGAVGLADRHALQTDPQDLPGRRSAGVPPADLHRPEGGVGLVRLGLRGGGLEVAAVGALGGAGGGGRRERGEHERGEKTTRRQTDHGSVARREVAQPTGWTTAARTAATTSCTPA